MAQALKPQDVVVLIKLCGYEAVSRPPYSVIANDLEMSQSEVNASVKRLKQANLLRPKEMGELPVIAAVEEFLVHGVKYAFPVKRGSWVRGMPTSYAAEPLNEMIIQGEDPVPVWPDPLGTKRGLSLLPLYKSVPEAAKRDPVLYARLALLDAIRDGGARQRSLAEKELIKSLRKTNGKS
jgi:hypothetical protein